MSIAALRDVSGELRRLAIAGSALAKDDFRLKNQLPILRKTGEKAAIFNKIADALDELLAADASASAGALLRASTLVHAVLYTQIQHALEGDRAPIEPPDLTLGSKPSAAKTLRHLIDAVTSSGSGRLEIAREAWEAGVFGDLRLIGPCLNAFNDPYPEMADFMCTTVLPSFGRGILPLVRNDFDPKGGAADVRRAGLIANLLEGEERRAFCLDLLENGNKDMRVKAIEAIADDPACLEVLIQHRDDRSKDVRRAALSALGAQPSKDALDILLKTIEGKDSLAAIDPLQRRMTPEAAGRLVELAERRLKSIARDGKGLERLHHMLFALSADRSDTTFAFMSRLHGDREALAGVAVKATAGVGPRDIADLVRVYLATCGERGADALLAHLDAKVPLECFEACIRTKSPAFVYERFHPLFAKATKTIRAKMVDCMACDYLSLAWSQVLPMPGLLLPPHKPEWDARWVDWAETHGDQELACTLIDASHRDRLLPLVVAAAETGKHRTAVAALRRIGYTGWKDLILAWSKSGRRYGLIHDVPLEQLSEQNLDELEALGDRLHLGVGVLLAEERVRRAESAEQTTRNTKDGKEGDADEDE